MTPTDVLTLAAGVATALVGGVLLAFSAFVMTGLRALPPAAGAEAMRAVNRAALRPPLMLVLLGALLLDLAAAVVAVAGDAPSAGSAVAGAALYVVGGIGVTAVGNVPLNERLARTADPAGEWVRSAPRWVAWNHVRALACAVAATFLLLAAR
ncbi:DUF1772 domain-containing protein [Cellulomonas sp. 179-A 9B4 NHS]|uniref:anthrone oxygenase family protein n=1 Tax=Cellulomonas sp. 179-A 9B4 NHS TaxID=3142379 RepID=UPI00399FF2D9